MPPDARGDVASQGSHKPAHSPDLVTLDVLFSVAQDATTIPARRRKAASEAALHFLPKTPARGWPGAAADAYGFVISPKMAIDYRDSKLQLRHLSGCPAANVPVTAKRLAKLRVRIKMIAERLECPCPALYSDEQMLEDRERVRVLAQKRQSKMILTETENAEEAHRMARSDSLRAGPEEAAKKHLQNLQQKARRFKGGYGPCLTRKERVNLRLLRLLYSPSKSSFSYDPDDDPRYHPLRDEPFAENGNLYPPHSRLRPVTTGPNDAVFVEFVDVPRHVASNPNYPDCPEMRSWQSFQKSD